jgi:hypothetical protein
MKQQVDLDNGGGKCARTKGSSSAAGIGGKGSNTSGVAGPVMLEIAMRVDVEDGEVCLGGSYDHISGHGSYASGAYASCDSGGGRIAVMAERVCEQEWLTAGG